MKERTRFVSEVENVTNMPLGPAGVTEGYLAPTASLLKYRNFYRNVYHSIIIVA